MVKKILGSGILFLLLVGLATGEEVGNTNLVGWWKFDEGQGNILKDSSGNNHDGIIYGATWERGKSRSALHFNGEDSHVVINKSSMFDITDAITLEAWIKPDNLTDTYTGIVSKRNYWGVNTIPYELHQYEKSVRMLIYGSKVVVASSPRGLEVGKWFHVVGVYDGKNIIAYLNGEPGSPIAWTEAMPITPYSVTIGGYGEGEKGSLVFEGSVGEVRIYNRALSAEEIKQHYTQLKDTFETLVLVPQEKVTEYRYIQGGSGDIDFGIAKVNGVFRYYRAGRQSPLIEYVSLSEGEKHQISIPYVGGYKSDWKGESLFVVQGEKKEDIIKQVGKPVAKWAQSTEAIPVLKLSPENRAMEIVAIGTLESRWKETLKFKEGEKGENILDVRYEKVSGEKGIPLEMTIRLMPWMDDEGIPIFVKQDKNIEVLTAGKPVKGGTIIIPYWEKGHILYLDVSPCEDITMSDVYPFRGGRTLTFKIGKEDIASLRIIDRQVSPLLTYGPFGIRVNENNGATTIEIGKLPLFIIEGYEDTLFQSHSGYSSSPWDITQEKAQTSFKISGKGEIRYGWKEEITGSPDKITYMFHRERTGGDAGVHLSIPYWLVGSKTEIRLPDGKIIKEIKGVPIRLGAELFLGNLPKDSEIIFYPTQTEKVTLKLKGEFEGKLYRKKVPVYKEPFDTNMYPVFYENEKQKGVIYSFPPAGILLGSKENTFGVVVAYERIFSKEEEKTKVNLPKEGIEIKEKGEEIIVSSPCWQILHSKKVGGGIKEIVFPYGTGENLLISPEEVYVQIDGEVYTSSNEKNPEIEIKDNKIKVKGELKTKEGKSKGIIYEIMYFYTPYYTKREVNLNFLKEEKIEKIGVLRLNCSPHLDECGFKPCVASVRRAVFPGQPVVEGKIIGSGLISLFKRGFEGIEFILGQDIYSWKYQVSDKESGYYAVLGNEKGGPCLTVEPFSEFTHPVVVKGEKTYSYYLTLPCIREYLPPHYFVHWAGWNWLDESVIKKLSKNGVNLIAALGNFAYTPTGGPIPPDSSLTPEQKEEIKRIKELISFSHELGMKVVPFNSTLLGKRVPVHKQHYEEWRQMTYGGGGNSCGDYGDYMCRDCKGWTDYLKNHTLSWKEYFNLDGMYYDFGEPQICYHPKHTKTGKEHLDIEGLLDFYEWSRKNIGFIYSHTGYTAMTTIENLTDMVWVGEEYPYWYSFEGKIYGLDRIAEHFERTFHTQRVPESRLVSYRPQLTKNEVGTLRYDMKDVKEYLCKLSLCGLFSYARAGDSGAAYSGELFDRLEPWLNVFSTFKGIDFTKFHFLDWKNQGVAYTNDPAIRVATYFNEKEALIVLGNSETGEEKEFILKVNPEIFGWGKDAKYKICKLPEKEKEKLCSFTELIQQGIKGTIGGYETQVISIKSE